MYTTDLSQYKNEWYKAEIKASRTKQILWYLTNVIFFINPLNVSSGLKKQMLKWFGAIVGDNVIIKPGINIKYPWKLIVGKNTWIGENVWIDNLQTVTIGSNVCISQGAYLLTGNHNYKSKSFDLIVRPIILEDGVWIGSQSVVCPGVICKSHSILTVHSVATKNLDAFGIYQGNPAVYIRHREIVC